MSKNSRDSILSIIKLYYQASKLKSTTRKGWELAGIKHPESVADHTFGLLILTLIFSEHLNLDVEKALKIALIHDLGEAITGDITPLDDIDASQKSKREAQAMKQIFKEIPNAESYLELWKEYTSKQTKESRLIYQLDKLEMALQARKYESSTGLDLNGFYDYAESKLKDEFLRAYLKVIRKYEFN